jgi:SAM-dependent methyltransferase
MTAYSALRTLYRRGTPDVVKKLMFDQRYPFWRAIEPLRDWLAKTASHNDFYDARFFEQEVAPHAELAADVMTETIVRAFSPKTVVDVGCGVGILLERLQRRGVKGFGYEYADAAIVVARARGVETQKFDLQAATPRDARRADVAVSLEVAEHLPASCADGFVDFLCACSDRVLFTAATPGQGGVGHINEQPHQYWIDKVAARGYRFDHALSQQFRDDWKAGGAADFYWRNVMIFQRDAA